MYFPSYITTALEDWVTNLYNRLNIQTPKDLKITRICRFFGIYFKRRDIPSRYDVIGRYKAIIVDSRLSIEEQREQFFHELCHILRHVGNQSMMPAAFRELQERDARHFTRYAALPHHMIKNYDLSDPYIVQMLSEDFRVTEKLCIDRLEQIHRNQQLYQVK